MFFDRVSKYWPEALSIVRIVVGLLFLEHGTSKLFGFPTPAMAQPAMWSLIWVQGVIEVAGGALFTVGLFTRCVAFVLAGDMASPTSWRMRRKASSRCSTVVTPRFFTASFSCCTS
jgi:putative oxidoreductase